jgi:uncharacterized membrane-anchored protein YitT (DUF2179 family)
MIKSKQIFRYIMRIFFLTLGALIAATGLELFLIPNKLIDGGIIGISILFSYVSGLPLAYFMIGLNLPFLILGYSHIGKTFTFSTLYSVCALSFFTTLLTPVPAFTKDLLLVAVFGGVVLGVGVGLILRVGGSLDGTEIIALIISPKLSISIGEVIMVFNIFILGSAGFIFGWENAMYSIIAYFVAYKTIDLVMGGLEESKSVIIISDKSVEISEAILNRLGRGVTHFYAKGGYTEEEKEVLFCVVSRLELAKLKTIVFDFDPQAFMTVEVLQDVHGGRFDKKAIHNYPLPQSAAKNQLD